MTTERDLAAEYRDLLQVSDAYMCREWMAAAAAELERLRAREKELEQERDKFRRKVLKYVPELEAALARAEAAEQLLRHVLGNCRPQLPPALACKIDAAIDKAKT